MPGYQPPEQSRRGQLVDAATILVLIFATLFATTYLAQSATTAAADAPSAERPVAELPVNPTEQAQYQRLIDSGTTDLATVNAAVEATRNQSDKYDISLWALLGTAALLALYLGYVYRTSFREYREVVEERFGPRSEQESTR
jgi:heme/copper-type cytochrome/quinol oxidase subunit 3